MQQSDARVRCWNAFGPQNFHIVLMVNAPDPVPWLFFRIARLLMSRAPRTFNSFCTVLHRRGVIRIRTQHEVEALFVART
jgi:hypothetical protein